MQESAHPKLEQTRRYLGQAHLYLNTANPNQPLAIYEVRRVFSTRFSRFWSVWHELLPIKASGWFGFALLYSTNMPALNSSASDVLAQASDEHSCTPVTHPSYSHLTMRVLNFYGELHYEVRLHLIWLTSCANTDVNLQDSCISDTSVTYQRVQFALLEVLQKWRARFRSEHIMLRT